MKFRFTICFVAALAVCGLFIISRREQPNRSLKPQVNSGRIDTSSPSVPAPPEKTQNIHPVTNSDKGDLNPENSVFRLEAIRYSKQLLPISYKADMEDRTSEEKLALTVNEIISRFGPEIDALGLNPQDEKKLRDFLIEREEAGSIAHDVVVEQNGRHPDDLAPSLVAAKEQVEAEVAGRFAPDVASKIIALIKVAPRLPDVNQFYGKAFAKAGDPLAGASFVPFAEVLMEAYGPSREESERNQSVHNQLNASTGLTPLDEKALQKATGIITEHQLEVFKSILVAHNQRILGEK